MHRHTFTLPLLFVSLIVIVNTHAMEREYEVVAKQAEEDNNTHLLLRMHGEIRELQRAIFSLGHIDKMFGVDEQVAALKNVVKTFFACTLTCKHFNKYLTNTTEGFPFAEWSVTRKNVMLNKVIDYCYNYKTYRVASLALVYSGAGIDAEFKTPFLASRKCLDRAVRQNDESAVALLLKCNANPYQWDESCKGLTCFAATTLPIIHLFVEKINKEVLFRDYSYLCRKHLASWPMEIFQFWFEYGLRPRDLHKSYGSVFHQLIPNLWWSNPSPCSIENVLAKCELLIKYMPDMINETDCAERTPIDKVLHRMENDMDDSDREKYLQIIELLRRHNGKTTKELEAEQIQ